jgi:hypothetical protein
MIVFPIVKTLAETSLHHLRIKSNETTERLSLIAELTGTAAEH